jgi:hypothetical protein
MIIQFFILFSPSFVYLVDEDPPKIQSIQFFVNPSRTIKSAVECLESSYFPVRRLVLGIFGKISPKVMKISVHVKITQMAYNGSG